ncbi:MAG: ACT domain-containing protein [Desulfovibrionaceae bacterium]|nr:ACT domain-containing protein [Desulfovibrionaceae bacterium]
MKAEQISVFLENRAGRLAEVTRTLREASINIRAMSLADTSDFGILRLIVSDPAKAIEELKAKGFTLGRTSVVAVQVGDQPGGLDHILSLMAENDVNVEYMYAFVQKTMEQATLIFRFDKIEKAIELLQAEGITLIPGAELYRI